MRKALVVVGTAGLALAGVAVAGPVPVGATPRPASSAVGNHVVLAPRVLLPATAVAAHATRTLSVAGRAGVPATGVTAAFLEVSVAGVRATGGLIAYATGTRRPSVRSLSVVAGRPATGLVPVRLGRGGRVSIFNAAPGRITIRIAVVGYATRGAAGGAFVPVAPARVRSAALGARRTATLSIGGQHGVPRGASAAAVEITVPEPASTGWVTAFRAGSRRPADRSLSFAAHRPATGFTVVPLSGPGRISIYNAAGRSVRVEVDVVGYYRGGARSATGSFVPVAPGRLRATTVSAHGSTSVRVAGAGGAPSSGVAAAYLDVTGYAPAVATTLSARAGQTVAATDVLSTDAGVTSTATVLAPVGADGTVVLSNSSRRSARVAVHLLGYVTGHPARDVVAPPSVSGLVVSPGSTSASLSWTNPRTADLRGVVVRRAVGTRAPSSPRSGSPVADVRAPGHAAKDAGLARNATYSYAVFAHDAAGNYARAVTRTVRLLPSQSIRGTVTAADGGAPIAGVRVTTVVIRTGAAGPSATTAADGTYELLGVAADTDYAVCFDARDLPGGPATGYAAPCRGVDGDDVWAPLRGVRAGVDAAMSTGGAIDGKVTDAAGAPLAGVAVRVGTSPDYGAPAPVTTDSAGQFSVRGLTSGQYGVCFDPSGASGGSATYGYAPQCLGAEPWAAAVPSDHLMLAVSAGTTTSTKAALSPRATISGKVLGPTGQPLSDAAVTITTTNDYGDAAFRASTGPDGTYRISWDGNTNDWICYTPPSPVHHTRECVDYIYGLIGPDGSHSHVDFTFATPAVTSTVVGKITDTAGHPLAGVDVRSSFDTSNPGPFAVSAKDGTYRLTGLPDVQGDTICFTPSSATSPASATGYLPECTTPVDHLAGTTTTVNGKLHRGGRLSGTVTDADGTPLPGLTVKIGSTTGTGGFPVTDAHGRYSIAGLRAGKYTVGFLADGAYADVIYQGGPSPTGYLDECWNDVKPFGDCTSVSITEGGTTAGIDGRLTRAGGVSGTVRDAAGHPVRHARVDIVKLGYDDYEYTDANGHYTGILLPLGSYQVCVQGWFDTSPRLPQGYTSRCYVDAPDYGTAKPVAVTSGKIATGVDVTLPAQPTGSIHGSVTDPDGNPLAGVLVTAAGAQTRTQADGSYLVPNVVTGSWPVCFDDAPEYVESCTPNTIDVSAGQQAEAGQQQLVRSGSIAGTITDDQGHPLPGALVSAIGQGVYVQQDAHADQNGHYVVSGLPAGDYVLDYSADAEGGFPVASRWSGGALDSSTATAVHVDSGAQSTWDQQLPVGGGITGEVRDESGALMPYVSVSVTGPNGFGSASTGADGRYRVDLPPGDYTVCFSTQPSEAAPFGATTACYGDTGDGNPAAVTVAARALTTGIDATLARYGSATVDVTDPAGHPLLRVEVTATDSGGNPLSGTAYSDGFGDAQLGGLLPGDYTLTVDGWNATSSVGTKAFKSADVAVTVHADASTPVAVQLAPF